MATQTLHFDMVKQQSPERVSVGLLNDNFDIIDGVMFANQEKSEQLADDYNASETYNTGDYVRRENYLYKCNTNNTTGTWDATKWDRVKVMDEITQGGGGGSSTLAGLNDVNISSPTDGQALVYDNATQKWVNGAGGGGSSTFAGLNDVNVTGVQNGDIARYNSITQKWTDSSDLTDLELTVSQLQASVLAITNGHTILDSNGTAMAQEDGLQIVGSNVADDGTNGKTVVTNCINVTQAEYDALVANDEDLPDVYYNITDAQPVAVNAYNLPYSASQSTGQKIDSISNVNDVDVTLNSTYFNVSSQSANVVTCKKIGRLVILTITIMTPTQNIPDGETSLIGGLPIPASEENYIIYGRVISTGMMEPFRVRLKSTGDVKYWYNNYAFPTTKTINGQIIYISAS